VRPLHGQGRFPHPRRASDHRDGDRRGRSVACGRHRVQAAAFRFPADEVGRRGRQLPGYHGRHHVPGPRGRCRRLQGRIDVEDLLVQLPKFDPGFHADLIDQHAADVAESGQCVRLPASAVESEHQQGMQPFPERLHGGQRLQLGGHF
jgi:hypothetical protein